MTGLVEVGAVFNFETERTRNEKDKSLRMLLFSWGEGGVWRRRGRGGEAFRLRGWSLYGLHWLRSKQQKDKLVLLKVFSIKFAVSLLLKV